MQGMGLSAVGARRNPGAAAAAALGTNAEKMTFPRLTRALLQGKPYFGSALRALQGDPSRHQYFEPAVRRAAALNNGKPIDVIEIGSWAGASAITWARALQAVGCGGRVVCIDTWAPYFDKGADAASHYQDMDEAARRGEIYRLFLHNIEACGVADIVSHHIVDSRQMESLFDPGSFAIVYIDGNHALDFVRSDIKAAKALASANAIVCGDDLELSREEVDAAAHQAEVKLGVDYAYSERAKAHYHPGVTEAVHEALGAVSNYGGFWAVERAAEGWRAATLDTKNARVPEHIKDAQDDAVELIGEVGEFNIVSAGGRFAAVSRRLGPTDVFSERVGERDLTSLVFSGDSASEVIEKARRAVSEAEAAQAARAIDDQRWTALSQRVDALSAGAQQQTQRIDEQSSTLHAIRARVDEQSNALTDAVASLLQRIAEAGERIEARIGAEAGALTAAVDASNHEIARQAQAEALRVSSLALSIDQLGARTAAEATEQRRLLSALTQEVIEADGRIDDLTRLHNSSLTQSVRRLFGINQVAAE